MMKTFKWNVNGSNIYTEDYGSQFLIDAPGAFALNAGAAFTMDAKNQQLSLIPNGEGNISWATNSNIQIIAGQLCIDCSRNTYSDMEFSSVVVEGVNGDARLTLRNADEMLAVGADHSAVPLFEIKKNGALDISIEDQSMDVEFSGNFLLSDNARASITVGLTDNVPTTLSRPTTFSLSGTAYLNMQMHALVGGPAVTFTLEDSAKCWLATDVISGQNNSVVFNIKQGKSDLLIHGRKTAHTLMFPSARFNFVTVDGANKGKVILNFTYEGEDNGANAFGKRYLLNNGMLSIDGVIQKDDSKLDIDYPTGQFMVINLKSK